MAPFPLHDHFWPELFLIHWFLHVDYSRILQEKPQMSLAKFCSASSAGAQRGAKQLQRYVLKEF